MAISVQKNQHSGALEHTQKHFRDLDKDHDEDRDRDRELELDKDLDNGQEDAYWLWETKSLFLLLNYQRLY